MTRETSIRLPSRLIGIVRTDPAAESPSSAPANPSPPPDLHAEKQADRARLVEVLARLAQATEAIRTQTQRAVDEIRSVAVDLAVTVASHFLMAKVKAGDFPFETLVKSALERLTPRQPVSVVLHPEDLKLLRERLGEENRWAEGQDLRWVSDPSLGRGDCKVETPDRSVLFNLEARLDLLRQVLHQASG